MIHLYISYYIEKKYSNFTNIELIEILDDNNYYIYDYIFLFY